MIRLLLAASLALAAVTLPAADDVVVARFESDSFDGWEVEGTAFGTGPVEAASSPGITGYRGRRFVNSFHPDDAATGTLTSPPFTLARRYVAFLIGGGRHDGGTGVELLVDGAVVRSATGHDAGALRFESWDVGDLAGREARVRIVDRVGGGWGHVDVDEILLTDTRRAGPGAWRPEEYRRSAEWRREPWRPGWHFSPDLHWINDPNGLVWADGLWHLFYQHNPHGNDWGHMSWGHATSRDLLHWEHQPLALAEGSGTMAFSGSAVVDRDDTSGLGAAGAGPLVAIYTAHQQGRQTQDIASSTDGGRTWTPWPGNPVLDLGLADFRDPKVFWHAPTARWVMVVSLALEKRLQFHASSDLKRWTLLSEFGPAGAPGKSNWECPDLFELPIEGEPGATAWVLSVGMGSGSVAGGSGDEYFVGSFDGTRFVADVADARFVDHGRDFYAAVSFSDVPADDGRRIWIGWMNNWETAQVPTWPWRGQMSAPRELSLRRIGGVPTLCQRPVREIDALGRDKTAIPAGKIGAGTHPLPRAGKRFDLRLTIDPASSEACGMHVLAKEGQRTVVGYDARSRRMFVDRTASGRVSFHPAFAGRHEAPLEPGPDGTVRLRILVDACSVEVFGNDGEAVITDLVFPDDDATGLALFAEGGSAGVVEGSVAALPRTDGVAE